MSTITKKAVFVLLTVFTAGSITHQASAISGWLKAGLAAGSIACAYAALKYSSNVFNPAPGTWFGDTMETIAVGASLPGMVVALPIFMIQENKYQKNVSQFIQAAKDGDVSKVNSFLQRGYSPNAWGFLNFSYQPIYTNHAINRPVISMAIRQSHKGCNPMLEAVRYGRFNALKAMLEADVAAEISQYIKRAALAIAIRNKDQACVKLLLEYGTQVSSQGLIFHAIGNSNYSGDDLNSMLSYSLLILAAEKSSFETFKLLFNSLTQSEKEQALEHAEHERYSLLVNRDENVSVKKHFNTLLLEVIRLKRYDILEFLMQSKIALSDKTLACAFRVADIHQDQRALLMLMEHKVNQVARMLGALIYFNPFLKTMLQSIFSENPSGEVNRIIKRIIEANALTIPIFSQLLNETI